MPKSGCLCCQPFYLQPWRFWQWQHCLWFLSPKGWLTVQALWVIPDASNTYKKVAGALKVLSPAVWSKKRSSEKHSKTWYSLVGCDTVRAMWVIRNAPLQNGVIVSKRNARVSWLNALLQVVSKGAILPKQSSLDSRDRPAAAIPLEIDDTAMFQRKKATSSSLEDSVSQLRKVTTTNFYSCSSWLRVRRGNV